MALCMQHFWPWCWPGYSRFRSFSLFVAALRRFECLAPLVPLLYTRPCLSLALDVPACLSLIVNPPPSIMSLLAYPQMGTVVFPVIFA